MVVVLRYVFVGRWSCAAMYVFIRPVVLECEKSSTTSTGWIMKVTRVVLLCRDYTSRCNQIGRRLWRGFCPFKRARSQFAPSSRSVRMYLCPKSVCRLCHCVMELSLEQRYVIKFCVRLDKIATDTYQMLQEAFKEGRTCH